MSLDPSLAKSANDLRALGKIHLLLGLLISVSCHQSSSTVPYPQGNSANINRMEVQLIGPVNYVALGDSTGSGVGAEEGGYVDRLFVRVLKTRPGSKLTNLCVSGATTADVLQDQLERAVAVNPTLVTLGIGINDIGHGVSLERFSSNYEIILRRLKTDTRAVIVVTNIPDISSAPRIPQALRSDYHQVIVAFNQKLAEITSRHGVTVFDIYSITHELLPSSPQFFSADGFHPSDKGYEVWAQQMWPTVARTIGVEGTAGS